MISKTIHNVTHSSCGSLRAPFRDLMNLVSVPPFFQIRCIWFRSCPISRFAEFGFGPALFWDLVHLVSIPPYFEIWCIWCRSRPFLRFCVFLSVLPHFEICWYNWCLFGVALALFDWPFWQIQGSWRNLQGFRQPLLKNLTFSCVFGIAFVRRNGSTV